MAKRLSLIPYVGGKSYLKGTILGMIPQPHVAFIEVFAGGASVTLNKIPSKVEVLNDIDGDIVNLFRVVRDNLYDFLESLPALWASEEFLDAALQKRIPKNNIERAALFYYYINLQFSANVNTAPSLRVRFKRSYPREFFNGVLGELLAVQRRLQNCYIERLDFRKLIEKWDDTDNVMYLDPPYLGHEGYYREMFGENEHKELCEILRSAKSRWILSYNDVQWVHDNYAEFNISGIDVLDNASPVSGEKRQQAQELIITNFQQSG